MELLKEMSYDDCRRRLAEESVGRVGLCTPAGPQIIPVNYIVDGDAIVFRTVPYGVLGSYARGTQLAFEVDHLDHATSAGWSVVATGRSSVVEEHEDLMRYRDVGPQPWAGGSRFMYVRLPWRTLSGRIVGVRNGSRPAALR
jgi:nitroimidazol reductase NimA-like FMN-containing flavoprotein (pyridoxamine 5'-phosphate oxidase superfamily)